MLCSSLWGNLGADGGRECRLDPLTPPLPGCKLLTQHDLQPSKVREAKLESSAATNPTVHVYISNYTCSGPTLRRAQTGLLLLVMAESTAEQQFLHPALRTTYVLSSDVFSGLLDWILETDEFRNWSSGNSKRPLHFIGGPGSGKVGRVHPFLWYLKRGSELDYRLSCFY